MTKRTFDDCIASAQKYKNISQWNRESPAECKYAYRKKWTQRISDALGWNTYGNKTGKTYKECMEKATAFKRLGDWAAGHKGSYARALTKGWHRKIARSLGWTIPNGSRTYADCKKEAKKYSRLMEWQINDPKSYQSARAKNWHRQIATELKWEIRPYHRKN